MGESISDSRNRGQWGAINIVMFLFAVLFAFNTANSMFQSIPIAIGATVVFLPFVYIAVRPSKKTT